MKTFVKLITVLSLCLPFTACVSSKAVQEEFETSVKGYSRMIRWQEIAAAGPIYVAQEARDQYVATTGSIKKRDVTITDFRILSMECSEKDSREFQGEALVEFDYYILPSNRVKTLAYKQDWEYQESGGGKSWKVKSPFPAFD